MTNALAFMGQFPIHKNLNTSFVNLSDLVRHLRRLQFVGRVQVELSSYEAEIEFGEGGSLEAREQDHISGRLSFGDDALQRIMIRSREPGGLIHVLKGDERDAEQVFVDQTIAVRARMMAAATDDAAAPRKEESMENFVAAAAVSECPIPKPTEFLVNAVSPENWSELLALVSELMQTMDESLSKGNFNFTEAFRNACGFVSADYPFLDPDSDVFAYSQGYITVRQRLSARDLLGGITTALARIMQRLREDPYYGNLSHHTLHRVRVLANRRKLQFDAHGLNRELQKVVGM